MIQNVQHFCGTTSTGMPLPGPLSPVTSAPSGFRSSRLLGAAAFCTLLPPESFLKLVQHVHKAGLSLPEFRTASQSPKSERDKFTIHFRFMWGTINIRLEPRGLEFHGPLSMSPGGKLSIARCELDSDNRSRPGLRKGNPDQRGVSFCPPLSLHSPVIPSLLCTQFLLGRQTCPPWQKAGCLPLAQIARRGDIQKEQEICSEADLDLNLCSAVCSYEMMHKLLNPPQLQCFQL